MPFYIYWIWALPELEEECFILCQQMPNCKNAIFHDQNCYIYQSTKLVDSTQGNVDLDLFPYNNKLYEVKFHTIIL